jgi:hypothetical protein
MTSEFTPVDEVDMAAMIARVRALAAQDPHAVQQVVAEVVAALQKATAGGQPAVQDER